MQDYLGYNGTTIRLASVRYFQSSLYQKASQLRDPSSLTSPFNITDSQDTSTVIIYDSYTD